MKQFFEKKKMYDKYKNVDHGFHREEEKWTRVREECTECFPSTDDSITWIILLLMPYKDINGHRTTDWFQIGKGVPQGCILSPCLFNLYAEYIMRIAGLDEAQTGIKIPGRNISSLRYADDTTLMAENKEELKSFLMKVKEESEKVD